jgi:uncharacterized protein YecE (DUF72 family)
VEKAEIDAKVWLQPELKVASKSGFSMKVIASKSRRARLYDYSDDELRRLSGPILDIANRAAKTHVIFNNCFEDQGQRHARALMNILEEQYQPLLMSKGHYAITSDSACLCRQT